MSPLPGRATIRRGPSSRGGGSTGCPCRPSSRPSCPRLPDTLDISCDVYTYDRTALHKNSDCNKERELRNDTSYGKMPPCSTDRLDRRRARARSWPVRVSRFWLSLTAELDGKRLPQSPGHRESGRRLNTHGATAPDGPRETRQGLHQNHRRLPPRGGSCSGTSRRSCADPRGFRMCIDQLLNPLCGRAEREGRRPRRRAASIIWRRQRAPALGGVRGRSARRGKLPGPTHCPGLPARIWRAVMEVHTDAIEAGEKVLVVDDLLATGGTGRGRGSSSSSGWAATSSAAPSSSTCPSSAGRKKLEAMGNGRSRALRVRGERRAARFLGYPVAGQKTACSPRSASAFPGSAAFGNDRAGSRCRFRGVAAASYSPVSGSSTSIDFRGVVAPDAGELRLGGELGG